MSITQIFLKAKHWHLFLLLIGVPTIFQIIMITAVFANLSKMNGDPSLMFNYFKFIPIVIIIPGMVLFGWFWSTAIGLQPKVPGHIKMHTLRFKIFFFVPMVYLILFSISISYVMSGLPTMIQNGEQPNIGSIGSAIAIIMPLHFFCMFCIFHSMYFVAKTFKTVELQRETTFSDFTGEFFLIWFYFIGVWIIQPKINKIAENDSPVN